MPGVKLLLDVAPGVQGVQSVTLKSKKALGEVTSLVAQWLRIRLPMVGTWV